MLEGRKSVSQSLKELINEPLNEHNFFNFSKNCHCSCADNDNTCVRQNFGDNWDNFMFVSS